MQLKQKIARRTGENPLPEEVRESSGLIRGLYYYYGIRCREDEWLAEVFWQGRMDVGKFPIVEDAVADPPAWRPECAFRTAMLFGPDLGGLQESLSADLPRDMARLGAQWLGNQATCSAIKSDASEEEQRRAFCRSYLGELPYHVWDGFDYRDPRPELVLFQAEECYDAGSDEDWRENILASRGEICCGGGCFALYTAAEMLYRLAAVGGNLQALETDVKEIEYYHETEFEDETWDAIAGAVRDAEKQAGSLQAQGRQAEAARWWRKSAAGGNPSGMRGLISCLEAWEDAPDRDGRLAYWKKRLSECRC